MFFKLYFPDNFFKALMIMFAMIFLNIKTANKIITDFAT
ncbi:hypothetical protein SDC9_119832 [bioreactor metagenome]|uniref:Uncharacterized protein n=1 Tax=bioreactor metagenome TaxID=1076179 RepID=A0A645C4Y9_9ZZZZ